MLRNAQAAAVDGMSTSTIPPLPHLLLMGSGNHGPHSFPVSTCSRFPRGNHALIFFLFSYIFAFCPKIPNLKSNHYVFLVQWLYGFEKEVMPRHVQAAGAWLYVRPHPLPPGSHSFFLRSKRVKFLCYVMFILFWLLHLCWWRCGHVMWN